MEASRPARPSVQPTLPSDRLGWDELCLAMRPEWTACGDLDLGTGWTGG